MALSAWWLDFKLERVNRKLKSAHFDQRRLRDRLEKARAEHKAGKLTDDAFREKEEDIRETKSRLTARVAGLSAEEDALKRARKRAGRTAS